jgi:hypothetical protein
MEEEAQFKAEGTKRNAKSLPHRIPGSAILLNVLDEVSTSEKICRRLVTIWSLAPPMLSNDRDKCG